VATDAARDAIVGFWKLVSYEDRGSEAQPWTQTFGEKPTGIGVYHPTGMLSMQVFADPDSESIADYVGYIGTFRLREARHDGGGFSGVVEHMMQSASDPELLAEDVARRFTVSGARLMLGDGRTWRRMFERV
jgi:hypothetical protein